MVRAYIDDITLNPQSRTPETLQTLALTLANCKDHTRYAELYVVMCVIIPQIQMLNMVNPDLCCKHP